MIGAKTLGTLTLLGLALLGSGYAGLLRPERVLSARADAAFAIGALGTLLALLMYRFWRLSEPSARYLRFSTDRTLWEDETHLLGTERRRVVIGENRGNVFDLPAWAQLGACLVLGLLLGAATLGPRAVALLTELPEQLTRAGATWCKPEEEQDARTSARDNPAAPGCALIRRAYALGYAKSLGDCEEKKPEADPEQLCTLRQLDEPALHYAYRLMAAFSANVSRTVEEGYFAKMKRELDERWERIGFLYRSQEQVMRSAPHAAHHIWTNLPRPASAVEERGCTDRFRELPFRLPEEAQTPSGVFEHVVARLLFETRYEPAAGFCREYQIHWGAPADACKRLAEAPEAFLKEWDVLDETRATLRRHQLVSESLSATAARSSLHPTSARVLEPRSILSFHCYMEAEAPSRAAQAFTFTFDGIPLRAEMLVVPSAPVTGLHVERFRSVSALLAPSFHYGALLSEAGLSSKNATEGMTQAFRGRDFLLTRAHSLATVDAFLEPEWLGAQEDLLEVYPYHLHLKNYVELFRQQYRAEKGRL